MSLPPDLLIDELEREIEGPCEPANPALEDPLSQMQSILENQIENTLQYRSPTIQVLPTITLDENTQSLRYMRQPDPLVSEEPCIRYDPPVYPLHRFHGSGSRARASEEGEFCFDRQERITREDCEAGCSHWDSESMECTYFEDWEKDHPPEGD